jgi:2,3-dihydroxy-2,3-dihydro-p-cumate dehydrogenase
MSSQPSQRKSKNPMNRFENRVAIVTGAASGIGLAIAMRLAEEGVSLVLGDLNADLLEKATVVLTSAHAGAQVTVLDGDLSIRQDAEALVAHGLAAHGRIDILVNCAGGGVILNTFDHTEETLRATIDRNLWTTIYMTLATLPHMVDAGYGRVVNIGAESVRNGLYRHAVYNAAKGGVHAFAAGLAREFAGNGITVNTVAPAWVVTPEAAERLEASSPDEKADMHGFFEQIKALIPMGRPGTVEEIAAAVVFAASDEASFVTGQTISVNGGSSMA